MISGDGTEPQEAARLELVQMRHPLLLKESALVVANDLSLSRGRGLILSGPNAGGKTVALKCLGLAAWMVRAGVPISADEGSVVGWFDPVLTDVGDNQSLMRALSTYGAARLSSRLAGDGPTVRAWGWSSLVSQAGFALGLANVIATTFPTIGAGFQALAIASVAINEMIGPVLFKFAVDRAGETAHDDTAVSRTSLAPPAPTA